MCSNKLAQNRDAFIDCRKLVDIISDKLPALDISEVLGHPFQDDEKILAIIPDSLPKTGVSCTPVNHKHSFC